MYTLCLNPLIYAEKVITAISTVIKKKIAENSKGKK